MQNTIPWYQRVRWAKVSEHVIGYLILFVFIVVLLFPFYWMVITSVKTDAEMTRLEGSLLWVKEPTLKNFTRLWNDWPFKKWFRNSVIVSGSTTLFSVIVGTLAAYSLVRYKFPGSQVLGMGMFVTYLVPPILLLIPMMTIVRSIGLYNSLPALILVYPTLLVPFCTWFLMGFFRSIPVDMEECARVDGATHWQAFWKVTLPLARPGIISAAIFAFTLSWSEYLYSLSLVRAENLMTLPVGIPSKLTQADVFFWGPMMAGALLGSIPLAIVYSFSMRGFVSGLTAGAVKG